jgi:hypothetical protein
MKKFFSIILLKTHNLSSGEVSYDETFISVKAHDLREAKKKAFDYGKSCEVKYHNHLNNELQIEFLKVIDTHEYLREEAESVAEIYSRNFRNIEAYSQFESLFTEPALA